MHKCLPEYMYDMLEDRLPRRPYCSNDLTIGLRIRPLQQALQHKYIQLNRPDWTSWLVFDVDRPGAAFDWEDRLLPPPSWTTTSRTGHAHLVYGLSMPVFSGDDRIKKPAAFADAVRRAVGARLEADPNYQGLITQNPAHSSWLTTTPAGARTYALNDFLEWVDLSKSLEKRPLVNPSGSRNKDLFDRLRHAAYQHSLSSRLSGQGSEAWGQFVLNLAETMNHYHPPLPTSEVRSIARSVARWILRRYTGRLSDAEFSQRQANRGKQKGMSKRQQGIALLAAGVPHAEVMTRLNISRPTVYRWMSTLQGSNEVVSKPNQISAPAKQQGDLVDMSSQESKQPCRVSDNSSQTAEVTGAVQ